MGLVLGGDAGKEMAISPSAHCMDTPDDGLHENEAHANTELQDFGNSRTSHAKFNVLRHIKSSQVLIKMSLRCYSFRAVHYKYL